MKFLIIFLLIVFLMGAFAKQIARYLLKSYMERIRRQFEEHVSNQSATPGAGRPDVRPGEIHVHLDTRPSAARKNQSGKNDSYTDYEEVK